MVSCAVLLGLGACAGRRGPAPTARASRDIVVRDVPPILRGTIGAEASIRGIEPQLISGFGIVVGLNGTGGSQMPVQVQATMERELARGGVSLGGIGDMGSLEGVTPRAFLSDPGTAVVIVEAAIPPGLPEGADFDVYVRALPNSDTTSLEGGRLWTTEMTIGPATVFGGVRTRSIAKATGEVFINPFADPSGVGVDPVNRTRGRVLGGGRVTQPLTLEIVLDNPSHTRARAIVAAINSRFPEGPGDRGAIARGRTDESVALSVPVRYRDRPAEFIELINHLRVNQQLQREYARVCVEQLKDRPGLSESISWCLQSVGPSAIPFLRPMYTYPEVRPRLAALRAGARLGDARSVPFLIELARTGPAGLRTRAIELLESMPQDTRIDMALRELLDDGSLEVRVASYEALAARYAPWVSRAMVDDKFEVHSVPSREPMVYITQQGKPRVVVFGEASGFVKPLLVDAWDHRLLMTSGDSEGEPVRMRYRNERGVVRTLDRVPEDLAGFVRTIAHEETPEDPRPGLDFSYSQVISALYALQKQGAIGAMLTTERDRLRAEIYRASRSTLVSERPESTSAGDPTEEPELIFEPEELGERRPEELEPDVPWRVVPLTPAPTGGGA